MSHIADPAAIRPRPHHYMNADGHCHAGDTFEAGTGFVVLYSAEELVRIVNHEKAEAWTEGFDRGFYDPLAGHGECGRDASESAAVNPYDAHLEH